MELRGMRGRPVLSVETGERFGEIVDVLIDPETRRIEILRFRRGGLFRGETSDVAFADTQSIGRDAVMVPNPSVLRPASEARAALLRIDELVGLRVVTDHGEARGRIDDAEFDPATGTLTALVIEPTGLGGLLGRRQRLPIDQVRTIGRDVVVIQSEQPSQATDASAGAADQSDSSFDRGLVD